MTSHSTKRGPLLRIAYLTEWTPYAETGVLRKLIGQVQTWRSLGHEAKLFSVAPLQDKPAALQFNQYGQIVGVLPQVLLDKYGGLRLGYVNKIISIPKLRGAIVDYNPDIIYYRQNGPWYPGIASILAIAPAVLELNTDESAENKKWSKLFGWFHSITKSNTHRSISGFVAVTGEIARGLADLGKPTCVISNAMWAAPAPLPASGNRLPTFVFVGSRTVKGPSWHGVDKIIILAESLPECIFHIVGLSRKDIDASVMPNNVRVHGQLNSDALSEIYRVSDIGIGSLALHRIGLEEACPLKTREYLMNGLPIIIGYREIDTELNEANYVLSLPGCESNVVAAIDKIRDFAKRWTNRRIEANLKFMSAEQKEMKRIAFLSQFVESATAVDSKAE